MGFPADVGRPGDTTTASPGMSDIRNLMIMGAEALELEFACMAPLVRTVTIPDGTGTIRIPYQTAIFEVEDYDDGDEVDHSQEYSFDHINISSEQYILTCRVSEKDLYATTENQAAAVAREMVRAQAEHKEARLLKVADGSGVQDLGLSATDKLTPKDILKANTMLNTIKRPQGSRPPPDGRALVINSVQEYDLTKTLSQNGAPTGANNGGAVQTGWSERILQSGFARPQIYGIQPFISDYIGDTIAGISVPAQGYLFHRSAIIQAIARDWMVKEYDESDFPGLIFRAMSDYGVSLGPKPNHVIEIKANTTALA